jgi:hypothetical protein
VTSFASLYVCRPDDMTVERVRELVQTIPTESLTVEYEEKCDKSVTESIAAMANTYGRLIILRVTDGLGRDRLAGVSDMTSCRS